MYFDAHVATGDGDDKRGVIAVATAANPAGPWSVSDPLPLDGADALAPSVVTTGTEVVMYYVATDAAEVGRIRRATSADGLSWTADPAPVLEADLAWERASLTRPNVVIDGDRWVMLYAGRIASGQGFAVSCDGVAWDKLPGTEVLTISDVVRPQIRDAELVVGPEGALHVVVENGGERTTTDLWLLKETSR